MVLAVVVLLLELWVIVLVLSDVVASVVCGFHCCTFWSCGTDGSAFCCVLPIVVLSAIVVLSVVVDSV